MLIYIVKYRMRFFIQKEVAIMEIFIVDEAEDFIVVNCCTYIHYAENTAPPWDLDLDDLWLGIDEA